MASRCLDGICLSRTHGNGTIGEYTTSGATVNASLITGLNRPMGIAVFGSGICLSRTVDGGTIGEYTTSGATVNASLITGLSDPWGIAVVPTLPGDVNFDGVVNGQDIAW